MSLIDDVITSIDAVKQTTEENDDVFNRAEFKFGAEARGAGGYGLWQLAVGSTGAGGG